MCVRFCIRKQAMQVCPPFMADHTRHVCENNFLFCVWSVCPCGVLAHCSFDAGRIQIIEEKKIMFSASSKHSTFFSQFSFFQETLTDNFQQ